MFHLAVVCIGDLDGNIVSMLDSFIVSDGFGHLDGLSDSSHMGFDVLSFVRNAFIGDRGFIIGVIFLDRNVLDLGLRCRATQETHVGRVGLHDMLNRDTMLRSYNL
jgi:hypothetical protein